MSSAFKERTGHTEGQTPYAIAKYLTDKGILTPTGKETWRHRTVENILSNEKYKGDARLQKCYTVDFLSKKRKANEGEVPPRNENRLIDTKGKNKISGKPQK